MELSIFSKKIEDGWLKQLTPFLESKECDLIFEQIRNENKNHRIWPKQDDCFNAFKYCKWDDVKVVILGQDSYHTPSVDHGLAFSSNIENYCPPSLINILKEVGGTEIPVDKQDYCLTRWATQGVLLLNTALTVNESIPGSHINIWKPFTNYVFSLLEKKQCVVYMLWGNYAKNYKKLINTNDNFVLESGHPSPLSANKGLWFGNDHFNKANKYLKSIYNEEIKWMN